MKKLAALAALPLVLAACSSGSGDAASSSSSSSSASASPVTSSSTPSLKVGQSNDTPNITTTLQEAKRWPQSSMSSQIGTDQEFFALKVKQCFKKDTQISPMPWRVVDAEGGEFTAMDASPSPADWPHPAYPFDQQDSPPRRAGSCATGWMMFAVNKASKLRTVTYAPSDGQDAATWKLSG